MTIKGILPNFVFVFIPFLLYFLLFIVISAAEENVDFPQLGSRKDDETYQIYRNPQSFQMDASYNIKAEDDITKNDSLVLFDKSKPKSLLPEKINSDEYIAPQRFEISQTNDSNRIHGIKQHEQVNPNSANQINETHLNEENKYDNFGEKYQRWNESLYHEAQNNEKIDTKNPYPPLPVLKQKDPEPEYFPPSFKQSVSEESPKVIEKEKSFSISSSLRDSIRTTVAPNSSNNRNFEEDITSPEMEDYDKNGMLAKGEEVQYSDDPVPESSRQTYSTEGIKRDPTMPFHVTHSLMDAMGSTTPQPTTYLQDSDATIHPTLVPGTVNDEKQEEEEEEEQQQQQQQPNEEQETEGGKQREEEEAMITSDYISNLDPSQRDRMFSRENLQPWERHRNEVLEAEQNERDENNINENSGQNEHSTYSASYTAIETSTLPSSYHTSYLVPASSIYAAPAPPLSSYILVPSGKKYYGDQAPEVQVISDSSYGRIYDKNSNPSNEIEQHKISRENIVTVEKVDDGNGSDLSRSPQFKLYGIKTAFHKGSGITTDTNKTNIEKYDTWLANPATIFDLPLPTILKTAFAVNTKAFSVKQHSDNSNLRNDEFELDESGNPLKYRKKGTGHSTEISIAPLRELPNVISNESEGDEPEIESYTDEEEIAAAKKDSCQPSDLTNIQSEGDEILSQCFIIAKNCLLTNAAPIERRINLNLTECAMFCSESQYCKSIGYSETMAICDIFAFLNGTSDSLLLRYHGTHYLQPTRKNIKKCLQDRRLSGITVVASNDPIFVDSNELSEDQLLSLTNKANPNLKQNSCPIDTDILTLKTENYRLRNFGIDKFIQDPPNSESECIFSCLIDLANGRLPFNCTSASYNSKTNECTLYSGGSNVNGNGHLIEEKNYEHYEKVCADDKLVQQCRGFPVDRIPQKLLMGFVVSREKAASLLECITLCFERYKNYRDCISVNYFYTEEDENCILSSESYLTIPQFFIDEIESTVDHASIDKCLKIKEDLIHVSSNNKIPEKPLAIDIEDGSRILPSTRGFDIVPTIDEKRFEINAIDGDTLLLSSNDIRRHPLTLRRITTTTTTTITPEIIDRQKLTNQLKKSIKRLKV